MKYIFTKGLAREGMDKVLIKPEEVSSREEPCFALLALSEMYCRRKLSVIETPSVNDGIIYIKTD
jgi:hypothetical protein